ncbi:MAG: hypothetical protein LBU39_03320 [Desulfobulbaceae bacterium]|nr:hypothetical protein [Desulfobulbaceae bacterium]
MFRYTKDICRLCGLQHDPFHKVTLNDDRICSLCANPLPGTATGDWPTLEHAFSTRIERARGARPYDGLLMLSGGKDSAYLSDMLKNKYRLNILGLVIDIGYEYPETFANARALAERIDIPYEIFRQDDEIMRRYYRFLFTEQAIVQPDGGQVCLFCGRFLIHTACDFARRLGIPMVFSGHNPDQIFLMGESIHQTPEQEILVDFLMETLNEETEKALRLWRRWHGEPELPLFPDSLHVDGVELLFPFQYFPYRPEVMIKQARERLNWQPIKRFSKTYIASGCRLVKLWAFMAFLNKTNSYVDFEFCNQIRGGSLSPDTARQFYEQAEIDFEELAELIRELDMVEAMKEILSPYGDRAETLVRMLA